MQIVKSLERMFTEGLINRREFIARLSALGIAATMSPLLIPKNVEAAVPKKGGHFIMGATGGSTTDSMDPTTLTSNMNQNFNWQLRNSLVEFDHNFNIIPELAESWGSTPDAKVWTFKL
ncbi:MAG: peptide ABC transporter substrate-binding protein, partial [Deltaproteobacteria bacterium]